MNKWFISHRGQTSAPLTEAEALALLLQQPDSYVWHPSFSQWRPAASVAEFALHLPKPSPLKRVPDELIAAFNAKQASIMERLGAITQSAAMSRSYLSELDKEINVYKRLTNKLSDEVKQGICGAEESYLSYQEQLKELSESLAQVRFELARVSTEFDQRVSTDFDQGASTEFDQSVSTEFDQSIEHNQIAQAAELSPVLAANAAMNIELDIDVADAIDSEDPFSTASECDTAVEIETADECDTADESDTAPALVQPIDLSFADKLTSPVNRGFDALQIEPASNDATAFNPLAQRELESLAPVSAPVSVSALAADTDAGAYLHSAVNDEFIAADVGEIGVVNAADAAHSAMLDVQNDVDALSLESDKVAAPVNDDLQQARQSPLYELDTYDTGLLSMGRDSVSLTERRARESALDPVSDIAALPHPIVSLKSPEDEGKTEPDNQDNLMVLEPKIEWELVPMVNAASAAQVANTPPIELDSASELASASGVGHVASVAVDGADKATSPYSSSILSDRASAKAALDKVALELKLAQKAAQARAAQDRAKQERAKQEKAALEQAALEQAQKEQVQAEKAEQDKATWAELEKELAALASGRTSQKDVALAAPSTVEPSIDMQPIHENTMDRQSFEQERANAIAADLFAQSKSRSSADPVASRFPAGMDKSLFGIDPEAFFAKLAPPPPKPFLAPPEDTASVSSSPQPAVSLEVQQAVQVKQTPQVTQAVQAQPASAVAHAPLVGHPTTKNEGSAAGHSNIGHGVNLQTVTSIFKSVFRSDSDLAKPLQGDAPLLQRANAAIEEQHQAVSGEAGDSAKAKDTKADVEGRMRRRSRRRG